jgi:hypothetical protein
MRNFQQTQSSSSASCSGKAHKVDSEIDLITNSISIQSRQNQHHHHQTDNKYLNLRRLNSNRIEKLNSLSKSEQLDAPSGERRASLDSRSNTLQQPIQSDLISSTNPSYLSASTSEFLNSGETRHENTDLLALFDLVRIENLTSSSSRFPAVRQPTSKKLEDLTKIDRIDESKLDVNKSLIEQFLGNRDDPTSTNCSSLLSRIDYNMRFLDRIQDEANSLKPIQRKAKQAPSIANRSERSRANRKPAEVASSAEASRDLSVLDYLTRLGASVAPLDAFQHTQVAMKHAKRALYQPQIENFNFKSINFCKLEFIYDESFYWIVKIKRVLIAADNSVLYQMKFVKNMSSGSLNASAINNTVNILPFT